MDQYTNFILNIPNGRLLKPQGFVITPENLLLRDLAWEWGVTPENSTIFNDLLPKLSVSNNTVANVSCLAAFNYFHWMFNLIPKFALLEKANIVPDYYYLDYADLPFQRDTLTMLGIDLKKVIRSSQHIHLLCSNLIVPSYTGGMATNPKWVYDFIRNKFLSKLSDEEKNTLPRRIFISRKVFRTIINEYQVFELLKNFNFQRIYLEELAVKDQAKLFANADIIVAIHGAGLTNLVFCDKKTCVIELYPPSYVNRCFLGISQQIGINHIMIMGDQTGLSEIDIKYYHFQMGKYALEELEKALNIWSR